jgi:conjugal transfer pilus assembly protein TraV
MSVMTPREMAQFERALKRVSGGRVRIPNVCVPVSEARFLWSDLKVAFQATGSSPVSDMERARFARYLSSVSGGGLSVAGLGALDRVRMLAFVALADRMNRWARNLAVSNRPWRRVVSGGVALVAGAQLAACTTLFGGNIKGNFSCSAPDGSCAPSTLIDDQALSVIQNARPMTPAGPYYQPPGAVGLQESAVKSGSGGVAVAGNGMLHRDRRVLKVVFPSFVDGRGNVHEPRVVHTVVDAGGWMQVSSGEANASAQVLGSAASAVPGSARRSQSATVDVSAMVPRDLQGWSLDAPKGEQVAGAPSGPPSVSTVEEARLRGADPVDPLTKIRTSVQARLAGVSPLPAGAPLIPAAPVPVAEQPKGDAVVAQDAKPVTAKPVVANAPSSFAVNVEE